MEAPPPACLRAARRVRAVHLVRVEVDAGAAADAAAGSLWLHGPAAIEERPAGEGRVVLLAGFADEAAAERVAAALPVHATVEPAPADELWRDTWRAHAGAVVVGGIAVVPAWLEPPDPPAAEVVVRIDPGTAFGSGSHPSTRLVLAEIERLVDPGASLLDVGSGSGVLAVAAALLGASVVAVDVATEAVESTRSNAARNGATVDARHALVDDVVGRFDVVVANIGAATLTAMAPALAERVGGHLVLAGLLDGQVAGVVGAYAACGLELVRSGSEDGWAAPVLRRSG
jgi:ribosomal protein L11 methyltransferase